MAHPAYEEYLRIREKVAKNLGPFKLHDTSQSILWLKDVASDAFEKLDPEKCFTFRLGEKFGFSEMLVNQLMEEAYAQGRKSIHDQDYRRGWEDCEKSMFDAVQRYRIEADNTKEIK